VIFDFIVWWALLALLGIAFRPIAARLFPASFADRGGAFAKPLAIVLLTYASWLLTSAGLRHSTSLVVTLGAGTVLAVVEWRKFSVDWRSEWLRDEALFGGTMAFFAAIRCLDPAIFGAEKYMDFAYFNTLIRAEHFPPQDPWMSGVGINYYYFGYLMFSDLARLTGITPAVAYNLSLAAVGAIAASSARSLGNRLSGRWWGGILAAIVLVFIGNLDGARQLVFEGKALSAFDYWRSTRVVQNTINEFPFFSVLHGDLHPHVSALVIDVTLIGVAVAASLALAESSRLRAVAVHLGVLGVLFGTLALTNPWDLPVYVALIGFIALHRTWEEQHPLRAVLLAAAAVVALVVATVVLSLPFTARFHAQYQGIGRVHAHTTLGAFVIVFGFLLLPAAARLARGLGGELDDDAPLRDLVFAATTFAALAVYVAAQSAVLILTGAVVLAGLLTILGPERAKAESIAVVLAMTAALALAACEVVFLRDPYGADFHRMNTVFKLYFQAWLLLAVSFPAFVVTLLEERSAMARTGVVVVLLVGLAASLCYPVGAIAIRFASPREGLSLDGLRYLDRDHASDGPAVRWLAGHADDLGVVLEATGDAYSYNARVSSNTGLPTVLGWANHEGVWRGSDSRIDERKRDVERMFAEADLDRIAPLLSSYHVRYVFIGELERQRFDAAGLDKFAAHPDKFERVYRSGTTEVFEVRETATGE
jgi:YYY domain-containing protein